MIRRRKGRRERGRTRERGREGEGESGKVKDENLRWKDRGDFVDIRSPLVNHSFPIHHHFFHSTRHKNGGRNGGNQAGDVAFAKGASICQVSIGEMTALTGVCEEPGPGQTDGIA